MGARKLTLEFPWIVAIDVVRIHVCSPAEGGRANPVFVTTLYFAAACSDAYNGKLKDANRK